LRVIQRHASVCIVGAGPGGIAAAAVKYRNAYVDHHQLRSRITLNTTVDARLPAPVGRYGDSHPVVVVSTRLLDALAHRAVQPKPRIAALELNDVRFADGSRQRVDVIINCAGYRVTFPFLDDDIVSVSVQSRRARIGAAHRC